jgi:hypothetical protein
MVLIWRGLAAAEFAGAAAELVGELVPPFRGSIEARRHPTISLLSIAKFAQNAPQTIEHITRSLI